MSDYFKKYVPLSKGTLASLFVIVGVFFFFYYADGLSIGGPGSCTTFPCNIQQNTNNGNTNLNVWPGPTAPVTIPNNYTDLQPILNFDDFVATFTLDTQTILGPLRVSNDGEFPSVIGYEGSTAVTVIGNVSQDPLYSDIAIGSDGLPMAVYCSDGSVATPNSIRTVRCTTASCEGDLTHGDFSEPSVVASESCRIEVAPDNTPIIAFTDTENGDLYTAKCSNATCTGTFVYSQHDSAGVVGWNPSLALGTDLLPVISYWDQSNTALKFAKCNDQSCTTSDVDLVDNSGAVGEVSDVVVRSDNRAIIAYSDSSNGSVRVALCNTGSCDTAQINTAVSGPGQLPTNIGITLDTNNVPYIVYSLSNGDVRVAHCYDDLCTSGASVYTVAVAAAGSGGVDIAFGSDGYPTVAFTDQTNTLRSLHCADFECNTIDADVSLSTDSTATDSTHVVIGADGLPIIAFGHSTNRLAVAKATTANFSSLGLNVSVIGSAGSYDPWYLPPLVFGEDSSIGVYGYASGGSSENVGVYGFSLSGVGLYADALFSPASNAGIFYGPVEVRDTNDYPSAIYGDAIVTDRISAGQSIITDSSIFPAVSFGKFGVAVPASYTALSGISSTGGISEDIFGEDLSIGVNSVSSGSFATQLAALNYGVGIRGESDDGTGIYGYGSGIGSGIHAEVDDTLTDAIGVYGSSDDEGIRGESVYQLDGFEFQASGAGPAVSEQAGVGVLACGTQYAGRFTGDLYFEDGFYSEVLSKSYVEDSAGDIIARRTTGKLLVDPANLRTIVEQCQLDGGCGSIVLP